MKNTVNELTKQLSDQKSQAETAVSQHKESAVKLKERSKVTEEQMKQQVNIITFSHVHKYSTATKIFSNKKFEEIILKSLGDW